MKEYNIVSIKELEAKGYSKNFLRQISHMAGTPFFRIRENGKLWVREDKLEEFIERRKTTCY